MYIIVKILNRSLPKLTYKIPKNFDFNHNILGSIVRVPLKNSIEMAFVEDIISDMQDYDKDNKFIIREIINQEALPADKYFNIFINQLAQYYAIDSTYFFKKIQSFLKESNNKDTSNKIPNEIDKTLDKHTKIELTKEQTDIVNKIIPDIINNRFSPNLIYGVTGSGKTEIYKELIIKTVKNNKSTIILLPEVSLAIEFYNLFKAQLKIESCDFAIYSFHSATGVKEKRQLWQDLNKNRTLIIIGVQLPIFLPISNLGLIIIDEEHDTNFQSKKHPRINSKEASLMRAKISNIPIVLGSATPSISSLYNAQKFAWQIHKLKNRFAGKFAKIELVKLSEKKNRKNFWITTELEKAIKDRLHKKEQIIIFMNRRGYSFFVQCKECGHIPNCINCSVSLTLHNKIDKNNNQVNILICHYCAYFIKEPNNCSKCNSGKDSLIKKGIGTQQIVNILNKIFINAKIARADLDTTVNKKKWQDIINKFNNNEIDILVGTQTITKGYDFKNVTLVGLLWADINLGLPVYNCAEVTLQQLIQVSGRAGRQTQESLVIIQTMLNHKIYDFINETNYIKFYDYEIQNRILLNYPPYGRFAEIEIKNKDLKLIKLEVDHIEQVINKYNTENNLNVTILGPILPPVNIIKNINIYKIYLKSPHINNLLKLFNSIDKNKYKSYIFFTPNPLN